MLDTVVLTCPHCGERFETVVDSSGGDAEYIEDCPVCCRPISLNLRTGGGGDFEGIDVWDPLESTCRHASLSIL